jgi:hypothetical protein
MSLLLLFPSETLPAFDSQFLSGVLPPGLTYTNSSTTRTYFGADGLLKTAAANAPIFEYNPVTLALLGMRWEMEQRTNLALRSQEIDNASWIKVASTVSANAIASPDGTANAESVIEDASTGSHGIRQDITTSAATHTFSVFLKASGRNWALLQNTTANYHAYFDISNGAVGSTLGTSSASITPVGGGWYRCSISGAATAASNAFRVYSATSNGGSSYLGNGLSSFYAWGIQVEAAASASSYIPTTTAAVTRQPDVLAPASISPWFNSAEGTILFECIPSTPATTQRGMYLFSDGTDNERMGGYRASGLTGGYLVVDGGVTQADVSTLSSMAQSAVSRHAFAYKVNDFAGSVNGGTPVADAAGTLPTVTGLKLGQGNTAGTQAFMGYARRFQYFNTSLKNQIQGMSRV